MNPPTPATKTGPPAERKDACRLPIKKAAAAEAHAPSVGLPLTFMLTGVLALVAGVTWILSQPSTLTAYHYNQDVIAVTHLFVLGWISSIVMGAMYQLVPVALETRLHSERLARWHFVFHVSGFLGMVWMFHVWDMKQVGHFGSLFALGVALFVYNITRTLRRAPKWNVTASAISAALVWISLAVVAGLLIAAAKCTYESAATLPVTTPTGALVSGLKWVAGEVARFDALSSMHAHAHLGIVGCFLMMLIGVSYKIIPMFTLSEVQSQRRASWSIGLLNVGLAGVFAAILVNSPWKPAGAVILIAALALYGWELAAILRARKRRSLDWGVLSFLTAVGLLLPTSIAGLALAWPGLPRNLFTTQLENLYGFLGILGVLTLGLLGMLYKVIPFLVWFAAYGRHIGRARVPAVAELYSSRLQAAGYWSWLAGLALISVAVLKTSEGLARAGCALFLLSLFTFVLNLGFLFSHWLRPRLQTLPLQPSAVLKPA